MARVRAVAETYGSGQHTAALIGTAAVIAATAQLGELWPDHSRPPEDTYKAPPAESEVQAVACAPSQEATLSDPYSASVKPSS